MKEIWEWYGDDEISIAEEAGNWMHEHGLKLAQKQTTTVTQWKDGDVLDHSERRDKMWTKKDPNGRWKPNPYKLKLM